MTDSKHTPLAVDVLAQAIRVNPRDVAAGTLAERYLRALHAASYKVVSRDVHDNMLAMLRHIGSELSSYELENRRPTKDELFALLSSAMNGVAAATGRDPGTEVAAHGNHDLQADEANP